MSVKISKKELFDCMIEMAEYIGLPPYGTKFPDTFTPFAQQEPVDEDKKKELEDKYGKEVFLLSLFAVMRHYRIYHETMVHLEGLFDEQMSWVAQKGLPQELFPFPDGVEYV